MIKLEIDTYDAFDYENHGIPKFNVQQLRKMLVKEIIELKNDKGGEYDLGKIMVVN